MNILILGGIAESKELALALIENRHNVIYSIAGLVRQPNLPCFVHSGGFSTDELTGELGLAKYCKDNLIELLIDATHPYAVDISSNATLAAQYIKIPCWRFDRPGWSPKDYPNWHDYDNFTDLKTMIEPYFRPFFSIGKSALNFYDQRPDHQQWIIRSAKPFENLPDIIQINAIGPFDLESEIQLMTEFQVDSLISKNSGCTRVMAKMQAAAELDIPVFVQTRPELAEVSHSFGEIESLIAALT